MPIGRVHDAPASVSRGGIEPPPCSDPASVPRPRVRTRAVNRFAPRVGLAVALPLARAQFRVALPRITAERGDPLETVTNLTVRRDAPQPVETMALLRHPGLYPVRVACSGAALNPDQGSNEEGVPP